MANRFPAQIWIGGQLSRTARLYPDDPNDDTTIFQGLIEALNTDGASHEYGDAPIDFKWIRIGLAAGSELRGLEKYLSENGSVLCLKHDQAVNGEFSETEQFCTEHNIPFNRWSDHYGEYSAENVYWRPGMKTPLFTCSNSAGHEVVDGAEVREAIEKLEPPVDQTLVAQAREGIQLLREWDARVREGIQLLRDICPELPPELEIFNITA